MDAEGKSRVSVFESFFVDFLPEKNVSVCWTRRPGRLRVWMCSGCRSGSGCGMGGGLGWALQAGAVGVGRVTPWSPARQAGLWNIPVLWKSHWRAVG